MPLAWGEVGGRGGAGGAGPVGHSLLLKWSVPSTPPYGVGVDSALFGGGGGGEQVTPSHLPQLSLLSPSCPYPSRLPTPPRTPLTSDLSHTPQNCPPPSRAACGEGSVGTPPFPQVGIRAARPAVVCLEQRSCWVQGIGESSHGRNSGLKVSSAEYLKKQNLWF